MNYYNEIRDELINNKINRKVKGYSINRRDLNTYYKVGKMLIEIGESIIKEYSKKLTNELGKGYIGTNLKYFRQFYMFIKSHTLCDSLSWSHYRTLLSLIDETEIEYYINLCKE